jgi:hypothetical protein
MRIETLKSGNPKFRSNNGIAIKNKSDEVESEFWFKGVFDSNDYFKVLDKKLFKITEYKRLLWALFWQK